MLPWQHTIPQIDASDPAKAAADLCACLVFLRDRLRSQPFLINPVLRELARRVCRGCDTNPGPSYAFAIIRSALTKAMPVLRPEVDITAATLSLLGLMVIFLMEERYSQSVDIARGDALFVAALRPLIRWNPEA